MAGPVAGARLKKAENDVDIYTIIFLALAVFIFLRLRNVLGQRTGGERPPFDRTARNTLPGTPDTGMVPMPGKVIDQPPPVPSTEVTPPTDRWKGVADAGTPLAQGLDAVASQDSSFDPKHFLSGARSAYEMIVLAFAVRFVSQMISVTRDRAGTSVDGNPDKVADITDIWTFARDTASRDPNWKLVGTGSAH